MYPSESRANIAFLLAVSLLVVTGISAAFFIYRVLESEQLVRQTYEFEVVLGQVDVALAKAGRSRTAFIDTGNPAMLADYESAKKEVAEKLQRVRGMTADNAAQQRICDQLETAANQRLGVLQRSIELKQQGKSDLQAQANIQSQIVEYAFQTAAATDALKEIEDELLQRRARVSGSLVTGALIILGFAFVLSAALFWYNHRLLERELHDRRIAENNARQLSERVMRIQDEERRKFSRELHDSLGQFLMTAKMSADGLLREQPNNPKAIDVAALITTSLNETRTLSHLLHPPLLDEVGFATAARWFVDGYSQRTGVVVIVNIPDDTGRLTPAIELTLFRVLQEALTNVHRHSSSKKAEVSLQYGPAEVRLLVKDYGKGMPREMLERFLKAGTDVGVGLAGMRARVREQGGNLNIVSDPQGTQILATLPISPIPITQHAAPRSEPSPNAASA
jgi:signal transduction histidine kinase